MRRVVITGIGIISSIGNNATEVEASLRAGKSGIVFAPERVEYHDIVHTINELRTELLSERVGQNFLLAKRDLPRFPKRAHIFC